MLPLNFRAQDSALDTAGCDFIESSHPNELAQLAPRSRLLVSRVRTPSIPFGVCRASCSLDRDQLLTGKRMQGLVVSGNTDIALGLCQYLALPG